MTFTPALDRSPMLPFDPGEIDRFGIRVTRAEFARLLGCSKQAVGEWVTAGKITLGADGRLDPRQAVAQLLRNSDPARLRARVLAPLVRDVVALQRRIAELEARLTAAEERAEFCEAEAAEAAHLRGRVAYLDHFATNAGDYLDELQRLVREREAELRATAGTEAWTDLLDQLDYEAAALAEGQGAPIEPTEGGRGASGCEKGLAAELAGLACIEDLDADIE